MTRQTLARSLWRTFPLPGFWRAEWELWHQQQSQPRYTLAALEQEHTFPLYPVDMSPLLALPYGCLDEHGVPYNTRNAGYPPAYQPTTIAQYALAQWNAYLTSGDERCREAFLLQARWLVEHEVSFDARMGGWPIPFPAYSYELPAGWLSALTQGNALSVLVRAYRLTEEETFLQVARRAAGVFAVDICAGGVSTTVGEDGLFFEEVAAYPVSHILNGFLLALFGLYDYAALTHDAQVEALIERSLRTLHTLLREYDTGYWSRYDLRFKRLASPFYHALHVTLLQALAHYSGCQHCADLAARWAAYTYRPAYFFSTRCAVYRAGVQRRLVRSFVKLSQPFPQAERR